MYNAPYFIPGFSSSVMGPVGSNLARGITSAGMMGPNLARGITSAGMMNGARAGGSLFSKLGAGLSGIKSINWGGLINNTSKTLGIINQTIPLVKQVGPMVNNMKSMLRVASLFKDETDVKPNFNQINSYAADKSELRNVDNSKLQVIDDNDYSPTFFVNN